MVALVSPVQFILASPAIPECSSVFIWALGEAVNVLHWILMTRLLLRFP